MKNVQFTISILGDICPTKDWQNLFDSKEPEKLFGSVSDLLKKSDYCIANLECPVTELNEKIKKCGPNLKAVPGDLSILKNAGIKAVSLANNHIKDHGASGVIDTFSELNKNCIAWFGAGENDKNITAVHYKAFEDVTVGFVSFAEEEFNLASDTKAGALGFSPYESYDLISEWKKNCDYLVVLYHGGIEHYKYPSPLLQKKCRKMISSGANLVLCQHSHCIGTYEEFENGTIIYGQGNSIFGFRKGDNSWNEGLIVQLTYNGTDFSVNKYLMQATENGLTMAPQDSAAKRFETMKEESSKLNDEAFLKKSWEEFCETKRALNLALITGRSRVFNKLNRMLNNKLLSILYGKNKEMITMNLIRCDAHREVITTLLEKDVNE